MFIYYIIVGLLVTRVPVIGKYFQIFDTLIHEIGHILAGILSRGRIDNMTLRMDKSGGALIASRGIFSSIFVTLAGYPFSSGVSFLLIYMITKGYYEYILYGVIGLAVISLIFWIRNLFGILWLITAAALTTGVLIYDNPSFIVMYATTLVAIVFVEAFMSTVVLLKLTWKDRKNSGDARLLTTSTGIPEVIWGIFFLVIGCVPVYYSFNLWF